MANDWTWIEPSPVSLAAFLGIVAAVLVMVLTAIRHVDRKQWPVISGATLVWMAVTAGLAASGVLEKGLPLSLVFLPISLGLAVLLGLSSTGRRLASLPLAALVGFQAFRLPLEIVLHRWYEEGVVPITITWAGRNFDVVTGVLAVLAAALLVGSSSLVVRCWTAWIFNIVGLVLLANVAVVAVLTSPIPLRRFFDGPPLQLAFHAPTVWIVVVCVAGALLGHVVLTRRLLNLCTTWAGLRRRSRGCRDQDQRGYRTGPSRTFDHESSFDYDRGRINKKLVS